MANANLWQEKIDSITNILSSSDPFTVYLTLGCLAVSCLGFIYLISKGSFSSPRGAFQAPLATDIEPNDPMSVYLKDLGAQLARIQSDMRREFLTISERLSSIEDHIRTAAAPSHHENSRSRSQKGVDNTSLPKIESEFARLRDEMGAYTCLLRDEIVDTLSRAKQG